MALFARNQYQIKIYFDSRDLIGILSRDDPISPTDLANTVGGKGWELVYSFANICEIAVIDDLLETRRRLQVLEQLPHLYIMALPPLRCEEFRQGVTAYNRAEEPISIDPFVHRWHHTYTYPGQPDYQDMLVNYSLVDQVLPIVMRNPNVCRNLPWHVDSLQGSVKRDRTTSDSVRRNRVRFENAVRRALSKCALPTPSTGLAKFAKWVCSSPTRCPGWRLFEETYLEFCANVQDNVKLGDISDYSHVSCLPYVDAITLDRRMAGYCMAAASRLERLKPDLGYVGRIYSDIETWLSSI